MELFKDLKLTQTQIAELMQYLGNFFKERLETQDNKYEADIIVSALIGALFMQKVIEYENKPSEDKKCD